MRRFICSMRCIFCKQSSVNAKSREHILPESIGNTTQVLPRGIVCDKCNNYFAREVEKPFLEDPSIAALRCGKGLESKRGRIPAISGILLPHFPVIIHRHVRGGKCITEVSIPTEAFKLVADGKLTRLAIPMGGEPPRGKVLSRFLAKVGVGTAPFTRSRNAEQIDR